jgi:1-acyl-sn-glycerol-3-phosphate acyltransferase
MIETMPEPVEIVQPEETPASAVVVEHRIAHHVPFALKWLSYLLLVPLVGVATIFFGCISLLAGVWDTSGRQQHFIARQWARVLLLIALSPVKIVNGERLRGVGAAVYASNHLSYYDTPVLFAKLPFQFRIIAKAPLWKIPFIGWYLNRSGQVPVDQTSARSAISSLGKGVKTLGAGLPLVVFPEGGRAWNGELQKMVAGAAWMAIKAQVPLVPLTLVGTYELLPIHVYALRPRPLKLIVGEPISTVGMTTREADALMQRVFDEISRTFMAEQV